MESIKGYDHWKTIPPEPEEEQEYCTCCGRPYRRSRKKNRNTAHAVEDLYTVVTAYTHLTDRHYVKNA